MEKLMVKKRYKALKAGKGNSQLETTSAPEGLACSCRLCRRNQKKKNVKRMATPATAPTIQPTTTAVVRAESPPPTVEGRPVDDELGDTEVDVTLSGCTIK